MKDSPFDSRHQCIEETKPSPAEPLRVEASQAEKLRIEASQAEPLLAGAPHEGEGLVYTIETMLDWLCFVCF